MVRPLPEGVQVFKLDRHSDTRGHLIEIFRQSQVPEQPFVQWNVVHSAAGVLRGVHVHRHHTDYLTIVAGAMRVGLRDLRPDSPTPHAAGVVEITPREAVLIPPGVAHGFHFAKPCTHLYGVTSYWSPRDELGCHWADPALGIPWAIEDPLLSVRDRDLPGLDVLLNELW
jgi:dTDP-4-dehydrorhamnose 3,5-epimerase